MPDSVTTVADALTQNDFYSPAHQEIFSAIAILHTTGKAVDIRTVIDQLRKAGKLEYVGGMAGVTELTEKIQSSGHLDFHCKIISEKSKRRQGIKLASEFLQLAYQDVGDTDELLEHYESEFMAISANSSGIKQPHFPEQIERTIAEMARVHESGGIAGIPSAYRRINELNSGYENKKFYMIAARPAMGKSLFMINEAISIAYTGVPVDIWSLEMSDIQQCRRILSMVTGIDAERCKTGDLSPAEWALIRQKQRELDALPIRLYDMLGMTMKEIRNQSRRNKASQQGLGITFIDYIQLVKGAPIEGRDFFNREREVSAISWSCKEMAKELNIPVVALGQLSRAVETRGGDKRPMLSDLRESGSLEMDTDAVWFLYRPEYYGIHQDDDGNPTAGILIVIQAKNREGKLDDVPLRWLPNISSITDLYGSLGPEPTNVFN